MDRERQIIIRPRVCRTVRSSRSNDNDYIQLRIWCDGVQYYKNLNVKTYRTAESINRVEGLAYQKLICGVRLFDWSETRIENPALFKERRGEGASPN
jgi:hypothetical protein